MNNISKYIFEKLIINKDIRVNKGFSDEFSDDEFPIPIKKKSGEKHLWFQLWEHLYDNGPMSKRDLLADLHLQQKSYSIMFARLSKRNIIVPIKGKLEAKDPSEWKKGI